MLREIHIENFKSVEKLTLDLGRINVFIGENGCGKSNILEAIAMGGAASRGLVDNEFLAARGIRVTEPKFMRSAFGKETQSQDIRIGWNADDQRNDFECALRTVGSETQPRWAVVIPSEGDVEHSVFSLEATEALAKSNGMSTEEFLRLMQKVIGMAKKHEALKDFFSPREFLIYAPENTALRNFHAEGQILPLGSKGEGLFAHLRALANAKETNWIDELVKNLMLIEWFDRFEIPPHLSPGERTIFIRDKYLDEGAVFDQRSANEGFLFLLFYFTLFISPDTPSFFAIDNVDGSLNPKLCAALMEHMARLAQQHNKQAILTTHNPALLDGLDLNDPEQRLFVIYRSKRGSTKARRILAPTPTDGQPSMKLSAAFLGGHIGGLPKNF